MPDVVAPMHADSVEGAILKLHVHEKDGHLKATAASLGACGISKRLEGDGDRRTRRGANVTVDMNVAALGSMGDDSVGFRSYLVFLFTSGER